MEIGSEFWISKNEIYSEKVGVPIWLKKYGNVTFTSTGRGAISLILDQIKPKIKKVMLPSYICESVILPFIKNGYELIYYDMDKELNPKIIDYDNSEIGIFFHMGYFGFPTNGKLNTIIEKFRLKSVIIIEDVTHTLFSSYQKSYHNDFIIGSIRKWFGIPSGGFLATRKEISKELTNHPNDFIFLRTNSLLQKYQYIKTLNIELKEYYLDGFSRAEQLINEDVECYSIDKLSKSIINEIDVDEIVKIRKLNYQYLLKHLRGINGIKVVFCSTRQDVTPFFFPIFVNHNRDKLRSKLIDREIYCPIHWPIPRQLDGYLSDTAKNIYDSILSLPCDQRYGLSDMKRMIDAIKEIVLYKK